jgi:CHAT domain-containing protein
VNHANLRLLFRPAAVDLRTVRDSLPPGSALIEFMPSADMLYEIVVTKDSAYLRSNAIPRQHLLSLIHEYNGLIGDARLNGNAPMFDDFAALNRIGELSTLLYHQLIDPAQALIEHASKLYIVPPPEFEWLPFHTLKAPGGAALAVKDPVSYLPSSAFMLCQNTPDRYIQNIVGLGHPGATGWDVEYELKDIRSFYDKAKLYFDTTATLPHLTPLSYELLHVAAPFNLNTQVPDHSAITLSDGQTPFGTDRVPLGNMLAIPVPQTLIFSNITAAAGGLSRYLPAAFLANGVHAVVATMWQGDRKSKKYFGEVFYTNIMTGISANSAYQMAIDAMAKHEDFSKSHHWGLYYYFGK